MAPTMRIPKVRNSEIKGYKVLIVDPNENRAMAYETKAELDPDLQRIDVFSVSTMRDARNFVKSQRPNVAIFPGNLEGFDFVTLQLELRNANGSTELVPLVEIPTLQQYRESKRIGGILDFAPPQSLDNYDVLRDLIIQSCRTLAAKQPGLSEGLTYSLSLQRALLINKPGLEEIKTESAILCREMTNWYDLGSDEVVRIILAEKLFLPELNRANFDSLLGDDPHSLSEVLSQTASWTQAGTKPNSTAGLIVTAANAFAFWKHENLSMQEIVDKVKSRPQFLMHVSLREMTEDRISTAMAQLDQSPIEKVMG